MSGERVVVVKKQKLPLTFGKRGAEAARSSLAELNQSQPVPNRTAEHWWSSCTAVVRYVSNVRAIQKPGSTWRRSLRKRIRKPPFNLHAHFPVD
jgi:hypothetical protein